MASAIASATIDTQSQTTSGGCLVSTDGRTLPLVGTKMSADARGGVARVILEQRFVNAYDEPLEVSYRLPLPAEGAVSGFSFRIDGRRVVGEVDTKNKARERFEEAILSGRVAALVEQQRSNQFNQEVGNVPPKGEIVCEIVVDQKLAWLAEGAWEWRFPTVLGPRYMGAPGRVIDAAALVVPFAEEGIQTRASLELKIRDAIPTGHRPGSPSHVLDSERIGSEHRVALGDADGVRLDRDVVVRWHVATPDVGVSLDVCRPSDGRLAEGKAYGLLTIVPPTPESAKAPLPRDLVFLIDTSGSMGGEPLEQSKRVICAMIDTLRDQDRLELIEFGSQARRWKKEPIVATRDGKQSAVKWVRALRASGGTEMQSAVLEALKPLRSDSQRQVVLITDGYIGFENEIIRTVLDRLPLNSRLHTIGVGSAPNRSLTGPAARAGGGVEIIIGIGEDAEPAAKRLLDRTTAPLVTEVRLKGDGVTTVPARVPDLYAGCPVLVSVELPADGAAIDLTGITAEGAYEQQVEVGAVSLGAGNPGIAALYGREWVEDLETRRACGNGIEEIDSVVEQVGLRFQIATRLTSWVAVDEKVSVTPGTDLRKEVMPHEVPYGTSIEGMGLRGPAVMLSEAAPGPAMDRSRSGAGGRLRKKESRARRPTGGMLRSEAPEELEMDEELSRADEFASDDSLLADTLLIADAPMDIAEKASMPAPLQGGEAPAPEPARQALPEAPAKRVAGAVWFLLAFLLGLLLIGLTLWILLGAAAPVDDVNRSDAPAAVETVYAGLFGETR